MDGTRLWITCAGMATHSCLSAWNNSRAFAMAFTLPGTRLSNSFQVCLFEMKSGTWKVREEFGRCCWQGTRWCDVLHGIWRCAEMKHSATQRLMAKIKRQKKKKKKERKKENAFLFLNGMITTRNYESVCLYEIRLRHNDKSCLVFSNISRKIIHS